MAKVFFVLYATTDGGAPLRSPPNVYPQTIFCVSRSCPLLHLRSGWRPWAYTKKKISCLPKIDCWLKTVHFSKSRIKLDVAEQSANKRPMVSLCSSQKVQWGSGLTLIGFKNTFVPSTLCKNLNWEFFILLSLRDMNGMGKMVFQWRERPEILCVPVDNCLGR